MRLSGEKLERGGEPEQRGPLNYGRRAGFIIDVLLVLVLGGAGLGLPGLIAFDQRGVVPVQPPATAQTSPRLDWRELANWAGGSGGILRSGKILYNALIAVDFDRDGDEGVLVPHVFQPGAQESHPTLYELDGTWRALLAGEDPADTQLVGYLLGVWDHDGDGTPALMVGTPKGEVVLCDMEDELTRLPGFPLGYHHCLLGDMDGNGVDELLLSSTGDGETIKAFDGQGGVVWSRTVPILYGLTLSGDLDGDGRDELLDLAPFPPHILGLYQGPRQAGGLPLGASPSACVDLNGDGTDEIICANSGYLDLVSGSFTDFSFPGAARTSSILAPGYSSNELWGIAAAVGDFSRDGSLEIAVAASRIGQPGEPEPDWLCIFDLSGELIHSEDPGEQLHSIVTVHAAGQDHLAVLTDTRLLVYP